VGPNVSRRRVTEQSVKKTNRPDQIGEIIYGGDITAANAPAVMASVGGSVTKLTSCSTLPAGARSALSFDASTASLSYLGTQLNYKMKCTKKMVKRYHKIGLKEHTRSN
jgi:hypothetical protein